MRVSVRLERQNLRRVPIVHFNLDKNVIIVMHRLVNERAEIICGDCGIAAIAARVSVLNPI